MNDNTVIDEVELKLKQEISALMDGEMDEAQLDKVLAKMLKNKELLSIWHKYHCIRDALRDNELGEKLYQKYCLNPDKK